MNHNDLNLLKEIARLLNEIICASQLDRALEWFHQGLAERRTIGGVTPAERIHAGRIACQMAALTGADKGDCERIAKDLLRPSHIQFVRDELKLFVDSELRDRRHTA